MKGMKLPSGAFGFDMDEPEAFAKAAKLLLKEPDKYGLLTVSYTHLGTDGSLTPQPHHRLEPKGIGEGEDASDGEATASSAEPSSTVPLSLPRW